jgi:hypothetical protein
MLTIEAAQRAAERIPDLEIAFPGGFGALARDLRTW